MIDTDQTGTEKQTEILENLDAFEWTDWEQEFIETTLRIRDYPYLSEKQKAIVGRLYDKLNDKENRWSKVR